MQFHVISAFSTMELRVDPSGEALHAPLRYMKNTHVAGEVRIKEPIKVFN